jgi:diguanylate cyclase (GGDEF)-like protein
VAATALRDAAGSFLYCVQVVQDLHERRIAEARIRHLAYHDPLTGLPNRALFQDRLQQALAQAGRYEEQVGLLLLDLDRFKDVNDTLGHDAGDALLREVARRLLGCVRESDTVARLGGDEFAVVLPRLAGPGAAAEVARKIASALGEPAAHADGLIHSGASVGITVSPGDGDQPGQLLKNADIALYRAKAEGRGGYCFFMAEMRPQTERRKGREDELRLALARGEIVPFYQPKVRLRDGRWSGSRRWRAGGTRSAG